MQDFHVLKQKELKNQWDYMKKQWKVWRGLINRTGHGYDPISGTFDWPDEVWENIIAVNSDARKYKTAPLQHRDLLEKLFEGLSATGDFAWSSGMTSVPPSTQQTEYVPLPDNTNVDETQVPHAGVDYPWEVRPFLLMMSLSVQEGSLLPVVLLEPLCLMLVGKLNQRGKD
ncbi:hypothetical protein GIB67_011689 [Kingdonia uniflora]|uniref:Myb/SANT-like domain-containing protein n=1 Tax=Kingdonia uniflora TaxID=39325 RepID=A0A7J7LUG9_9MAGN|nr:hypothetical protein GIB67_011689 [Kingdonia uniflora]